MIVAIRRAGWGLATLFGASVVAFLLMRVVPGDPAKLAAGQLASKSAVEAQRHAMGLDQALPLQYLDFIKGIVSGNWGYAFSQGQSVRAAITGRLMASVELGLSAFVLGVVVALVLALLAAYTRRRWVDAIIRGLSSFGMSVPQFWTGLMLLVLFSSVLRLLPGPDGRLSPGVAPPPHITGLYTLDSLLSGQFATFVNAASHLVLPAIAMCLPLAGFLLRLLRANLIDASREHFMLVLTAKGSSRRRAYLRHALPNAALPSITAAGLMLAELLAGSVLTEKVFAWPGVGSLVVDSVLVKDFAVVQAFVMLSAVAYVVVNTAVDIAYNIIDPRTKGVSA